MKYDFEMVAHQIETWYDGSRYVNNHPEKKKDVAKKWGISRPTLDLWFKKFWDDRKGHTKRYGDLYQNMWIDGMEVETVKEHLTPWSYPSYRDDVIVSEGVLMIPYSYCLNVYNKKWYRALNK